LAAGLLVVGCAALFGVRSLPQTVSVEMQQTVVRSLVTVPQVRVRLSVQSRLPATFQGLDGELQVAGLPTEFRMEGLAPGDRIARNEHHEILVYVTLGTRQVTRAATRVLLGETVPVSFEGVVSVEVFGLGVEVPISIHDEIDFPS
jgi:hypothetical protein